MSLAPRIPRCDPRPVHVNSAVDKAAMRQVLLRFLRFSHVCIIPPMVHTNLYLTLLLKEGQAGEDWLCRKASALHVNGIDELNDP